MSYNFNLTIIKKSKYDNYTYFADSIAWDFREKGSNDTKPVEPLEPQSIVGFLLSVDEQF